MRKVQQVQTSFTGGELDPELAGRIEVARYYSGGRRLRNVLVRPQGGARRRPGFRHRADLPEVANLGARMIPFAFNADQTYLVVLYAGGFSVFGPTGALLFEELAGHPWSSVQAGTMNWAQSADTLLLFNQTLPPQRIRRMGSDSAWSRDALPLGNIPTFDYGAVASVGSITPSSDQPGLIGLSASDPVFGPGMVGWDLVGNGGRARITAFFSSTSVQAQALPAFSSTDPIAAGQWSLREPVISAARGWPECGTFHDGRLWLGGLASRPSTLMASRVAEFFDFSLGTGLDDDGLLVTLDTDQLNAIHQLLSARGLQIYTSGAEAAVVVEPPITPTNVSLQVQTYRGAKRFSRVAELDGAALFIQRGGAALRQFVYEELEQAWRADLLSLLAPHLMRDPRDVVVRRGSPDDDADHVLLHDLAGVTVLTSLRSQEVAAFSRLEFDGEVVGAAALDDGEVFLAVVRQGRMRLLQWDAACLLDHGVRVTGLTTAPYEVTGLAHLAGRECQVVADGRVLPPVVVDGSGVVTLEEPADVVEVGLGFAVEVETMPVEPRDPAGALIGKRCRIVGAAVRVRETGIFDLGGTALAQRVVGEPPAPPLDTAPAPPLPAASRDIRLDGLMGWRRQHTLRISQPATRPQPLTVLAIAMEIAPGGPL